MADISKEPQTYYEVLFGTPERAARTVEKYFDATPTDWCFINEIFSHHLNAFPHSCKHCPLEWNEYGCEKPEAEGWLSRWLTSEITVLTEKQQKGF